MIQGLYPIFDHWHKENTVWIYSDPHFGDEVVAGASNPPSDEEQVKMINSKVGRKDTFICLGDIGIIDYVRKIRAGRKILIMGNHDAGRSNYERKKIILQFDKEKFSKQEALAEAKKNYPDWNLLIDEGYQFNTPFTFWEIEADNRLFDEVYEGPLMIAEKLILSHEPVNIPWAFNIHGHIHDMRCKNDSNHFNCCSNTIGYIPINFNQWMKEGHLAHIKTIHRTTIDKATIRKSKKKSKI